MHLGHSAMNNPVIWIDPMGLFVVFIDPGHGGDSLGAIGLYRMPVSYLPSVHSFLIMPVFEKNINLDVSLRLKSVLESHGITVHMSRTTDVSVTEYDRAQIGRAHV